MSAVEAPADPTAPKRTSLKAGFGFAAGSFVANAVVGLFSAVLTARVYGVEVIGEFALATAPWLTLVQFSSVAEQVALQREVATMPLRDPRATALFLPVLGFSFSLTSLAAVPITLLGIVALRGPIDQPELVAPAVTIVVAYCLLENTSWNVDALFAGFRAARELFWSRLTQVSTFVVLALALRPAFDTVWGLIYATVGSFVAALLLRLVLLGRVAVRRVPWSAMRDGAKQLPAMLGFAVRLVPSRLIGGLTSNAATWILGATAPVAVVGAYSRASTISVRMNDAGYRVSEILFPALVERHKAGDREGFERVLLETVRFVALPLLLVATVGGGAAGGVMAVFGGGFVRAADALALLLLAVALVVTASVQMQPIVAIGRPGLTTWLALTRAITTVGPMYPAAVRWGDVGVAGCLVLGAVVLIVVQAALLRRLVLSRRATRVQARLLLTVVLSGAAGFATARFVDTSLGGFLGTLGAMVAGSLAYGVVTLLTGGMRDGDRERVQQLVARVRRRQAA